MVIDIIICFLYCWGVFATFATIIYGLIDLINSTFINSLSVAMSVTGIFGFSFLFVILGFICLFLDLEYLSKSLVAKNSVELS